MGTCCKSNNEERINKQRSIQNTPSSPSLESIDNNYDNNYDLKISNLQNTNTNNSLYGIFSQTTKAETSIYNNIFTENDLQKMYYNLMKLMGTGTEKETIGKGGQAIIRKYYSPKFKRMVVEKVINVSNSTRATIGENEIMNRINLIKEAIILYGFDHPNVVKIYDFKSDPLTIVMEYCEKGSLRNILDKGFSLPLIYKIYLIYSICNGLNYVHSKGIVHGDLKSDNILLSLEKKYFIGKYYYPIPKLADFGLGQFRPNYVAAGTPGFIAPEIFRGSGLNFKTDIFALGMVMFEILSGLRPVSSNSETAMYYLQQKKIPCTKEVLRKAWELRYEKFLPGIKNPIYDAFYM